jgi:uncharacterized peroxidase-related enzyme
MDRVAPKSEAETRAVYKPYDAVQGSNGFVPTSFHTLAHRPEILDGLSHLAGAVLGPGTVTRELKQLVAYVASRSAGCLYCQSHTSHGAHNLGVSDAKIQGVWEFESDPQFDAAERSALRVARDAALVPNAVTDDHFVALREHFSDEQMVEIVSVISLFGFLNRWNDTMATGLEEGALAFGAETLALDGWTAGKHA